MARIPMKGDPKSLAQMVSDGDIKDPSVALAEMYSSAMKAAHETADPKEKDAYLKQASKVERLLAERGFKIVPAAGAPDYLQKR